MSLSKTPDGDQYNEACHLSSIGFIVDPKGGDVVMSVS
jgi:hypothetical protein